MRCKVRRIKIFSTKYQLKSKEISVIAYQQLKSECKRQKPWMFVVPEYEIMANYLCKLVIKYSAPPMSLK